MSDVLLEQLDRELPTFAAKLRTCPDADIENVEPPATDDELTPQQQQMVQLKSGGKWPPPSDGMLCFAEFFVEADSDQVLFDVSGGMTDGEYPIMY